MRVECFFSVLLPPLPCFFILHSSYKNNNFCRCHHQRFTCLSSFVNFKVVTKPYDTGPKGSWEVIYDFQSE